ncbi:nuclear transport factor 2 family protein [Novosphingobium malaysiense]|uniref:SnoaL-like domain-containing protein n=1 Tax=Novosphingobium malaysiense TaxID=1348853 RepID=A0A0B1ZF79_9SPHN|nr:nuclear transport factor 2 family protein [Novosphingobium malaysiense]KHK89130.1 hypothetical protein LK12_22385 [Novosphingobium malaysiense]
MTEYPANGDTLRGLEARIARMEAVEEIRQLPAKYAVCLDQRDYDALVNLFVDDIGVPGKRRGRQALKAWYCDTVRGGGSKSTAHLVGNHIIEFENDDLATGLVYSRNQLETGERWMVEMMVYLDRYARVDGRWFFQRRTPFFLYQCPMDAIPLDEFKITWGDGPPAQENFHAAFPSWQEFWSDSPNDDLPVPPPSPLGRFVETLRRGQTMPRVKPAGTMRADT